MGVWGLTSFVKENGHILQDVQFKNSKLVIGGCNLYYVLYFGEVRNQNHGGEYDYFAAAVTRFIEALRSCGIEPYVVLDGGTDYTDKKFDTRRQRTREKIQKARVSWMYKERQDQCSVLPPMVNRVFTQVLTNLKVPFANCTAEADREVASLANEWNCPVLSNDSDFFIFDIPAGFLPFSHFQWQQGPTQSFIPAKRFTTAIFCGETHFNINPPLLPVFAAIAGNDYIEQRNMDLDLQWAKYSKGSDWSAHLDGLLRWLGGFQTQGEALEGIIGDCDGQTITDIQRGLEEYTLHQSSLGLFFAQGAPPRHIPGPVNVLPAWALFSLTQGKLTSYLLDILIFQRVILSVSVEDASLPSGQRTSRPIRQVLYGLLLVPTAPAVEEYDREGLELTSHMVQPVRTQASQQLHLETMPQEPQLVRVQVMLETLGVVSRTLRGLPPLLTLPVGVTCYWLGHAQPPPRPEHLRALLLGMVYGEFCRQRRTHRGLTSEESVLDRLTGVASDYHQLCRVAIKASSYSRLDLGVAHAFSQWQSCLMEALCLNQLLCFPLLEPECAGLYKGSLVHWLVAELRKGTTPDSLLAGGPGCGWLYHAMLDAVLHSQEDTSRAMAELPADLQRLALAAEEEESGSRRT